MLLTPARRLLPALPATRPARPSPGLMSYDHRMRTRASDYATAAVYLTLFAIGGLVIALLSPRESVALRLWASTDVANLLHHPVAALVLSVFLPSGVPFVWLVPIALTMFGANRAIGAVRLALICGAGDLIGTAVSEGIVGYRVDHGSLARTWLHIPDVGPSYVVVSAIVVAVMFGTWLTRVTALTVFAVLVFISRIFAGLTSLHVAAVGHLTAIVTAAALGLALAWGQRGRRRRAGEGTDGQLPGREHRGPAAFWRMREISRRSCSGQGWRSGRSAADLGQGQGWRMREISRRSCSGQSWPPRSDTG